MGLLVGHSMSPTQPSSTLSGRSRRKLRATWAIVFNTTARRTG